MVNPVQNQIETRVQTTDAVETSFAYNDFLIKTSIKSEVVSYSNTFKNELTGHPNDLSRFLEYL